MNAKKVADSTADRQRDKLFAKLREQKQAIVAVTARDTGIAEAAIDPAFEHILDLVSEPEPTPERIAAFREEGIGHARSGVLGTRVIDGYLSLNWAIWEAGMQQSRLDHAVVLDLADRLMRGIDSAVAALAQGYVEVELEMTAAHAERRRSVLEELLTAPRSTPESRTRIRRRSEHHGLPPTDSYRIILIVGPSRTDDVDDETVDRLERAISVPASHHRQQPSIRLPQVLEWRGRILVFAKADWVGEGRLREALPKVLGDEWVAVDSGPISGCEALADSLAIAEYAVAVAVDLGRRDWIDDPSRLALETNFLLDQSVARMAIDQELGPLLADERMGEELIETLEVYLGSRQNIRETARRLHLAPRTVAYRLERIETLLGEELEGEASIRLSAAVLALKVTRQTERDSPA